MFGFSKFYDHFVLKTLKSIGTFWLVLLYNNMRNYFTIIVILEIIPIRVIIILYDR